MFGKFRDKGFTIVEVAVVVAILGIVISPFFSMFSSAQKLTRESKQYLSATYAAQEKVEEVLNIPVASRAGNVALPTTTPTDPMPFNAVSPYFNQYTYKRYIDSTPVYANLYRLNVEIFWRGSFGTNQSYKVVTLIEIQT